MSGATATNPLELMDVMLAYIEDRANDAAGILTEIEYMGFNPKLLRGIIKRKMDDESIKMQDIFTAIGVYLKRGTKIEKIRAKISPEGLRKLLHVSTVLGLKFLPASRLKSRDLSLPRLAACFPELVASVLNKVEDMADDFGTGLDAFLCFPQAASIIPREDMDRYTKWKAWAFQFHKLINPGDRAMVTPTVMMEKFWKISLDSYIFSDESRRGIIRKLNDDPNKFCIKLTMPPSDDEGGAGAGAGGGAGAGAGGGEDDTDGTEGTDGFEDATDRTIFTTDEIRRDAPSEAEASSFVGQRTSLTIDTSMQALTDNPASPMRLSEQEPFEVTHMKTAVNAFKTALTDLTADMSVSLSRDLVLMNRPRVLYRIMEAIGCGSFGITKGGGYIFFVLKNGRLLKLPDGSCLVYEIVNHKISGRFVTLNVIDKSDFYSVKVDGGKQNFVKRRVTVGSTLTGS